jgi:hypothetical protein
MATTTPNYGWAVPTSTDLVKNGATAIETLGDAIDASMNTALGTKKAGMVLLNTTSFSAVSSGSVSTVFSSTYSNYRIDINFTSASSNPDLYFRIRSATTDLTSGYYGSYGANTSDNSAWGVTAQSNTGFWIIGELGTLQSVIKMELTNPFATTYTTHQSLASRMRATPASRNFIGQGVINNTNSYDGFTIYTPAAETFTGTVKTYGWN